MHQTGAKGEVWGQRSVWRGGGMRGRRWGEGEGALSGGCWSVSNRCTRGGGVEGRGDAVHQADVCDSIRRSVRGLSRILLSHVVFDGLINLPLPPSLPPSLLFAGTTATACHGLRRLQNLLFRRWRRDQDLPQACEAGMWVGVGGGESHQNGEALSTVWVNMPSLPAHGRCKPSPRRHLQGQGTRVPTLRPYFLFQCVCQHALPPCPFP